MIEEPEFPTHRLVRRLKEIKLEYHNQSSISDIESRDSRAITQIIDELLEYYDR